MNWPGIIQQLAPGALPTVIEAFGSAESIFADFKLNSPLRQSHFLAQALHETGGFRKLEEDLAHYKPETILKLWPTRVRDLAMATKLSKNADALANCVYGNRFGNTSPGDGARFKGGGIFQLTFRGNYARIGKLAQLPLEVQPELVKSSRYMLQVALHYWNDRNISPLADADDLHGVTEKINSVCEGIRSRGEWLFKAKAVLGA